jgi:RNA polymerase sigma-70 factor (ECF subfamily)
MAAMPARSAPLELEVLLEHADWLRRLARALVSDDLVDDVVQETWVASLRQPPRQEDAVRAWLRRVAGNVVRTRFRSDRRRQARELLVGLLDQPAASPGETVERSETSRVLAGHLARLREPYRQVILLRYYDDLSSADISRRLGLPAGTVRRRLKVGLDRLRESLEARHDRAPVWLWPAATTGAAALGVVLAVVVGAVRSPASGGPVAAAPAGVIEGVVSGGDDRPVGGALVTLSSLTTHRPVADLRTRGDGSYRFARLRPDRYTLSAVAEDGWATRQPLAVREGARLRFDLTLEGRVLALEGQVSDAGEIVPGATVTAWEDRTDWMLERVYQVPVDDDGHYRLLLPPGRYRMRAVAPGHARSFAYPDMTGERTIDFDLRPLMRVAARLVDQAGQPVGGARIAWLNQGGRVQRITADAGGRFTAAVEPEANPLWVRRGDLFASAEIGALRPGPRGEAPLVLSRGREVRGRVLSEDGRPLAGVTVLARDAATTPSETELVEPIDTTVSDGAGAFRLAALPPGPLALDARGPGLAPITARLDAGDATVELRLPPGAEVTGRARLAGGAPAVHALVMALVEAPGREPSYRNELTDDQGAFRLAELPAARVQLLVQSGSAIGAATLEPLSAGGRRAVAITLGPAVWVAGRATCPDGTPAAGVPVEAATGLPTAHFGLYAAAVSDDTGHFLLGPLAPGPVSLRPGWGGLPAEGAATAVRTIEVRAGQRPSVTLAVPRSLALGR